MPADTGCKRLAPDLIGWAVLSVILGLYCVAIGAMFTGVRLIGPVHTSMIMCLEPLIAIGFAILFLGEHMTLQQAMGATLVVIAIIVAEGSKGRSSRA